MRFRTVVIVVVTVAVIALSGCLGGVGDLMGSSTQNMSVGDRGYLFTVETVETRDTVSTTEWLVGPPDPQPISSGPETQLVLVQFSIRGHSEDRHLLPDSNDAIQIRRGNDTRTPISVANAWDTSRPAIYEGDSQMTVLNLSKNDETWANGWFVFEVPASWGRVQITLDVPTVDADAGPDASWCVDLEEMATTANKTA